MTRPGDWRMWLALALVWICVGTAIDATASPVANFSRTSIRFDNVAPFEGTVQPVFLTNTGDAPLHVSAVALGGANASQFTLGGTCSAAVALVAGGGRCRIEVISAVTSGLGPATRSATVLVTSDAATDPATITISANVSGGHEPLLRPNWLDFAPQPVGGAATTQSFLFTNPFGATLSIDRLVLTGADAADFTLASDCTRLIIGGNCTITIGFAPSVNGPRSTELELGFRASDDPTNLHLSHYSLTGVGGSSSAAFNIDQHGITGSWFQASTSGQGVELEVFPDLVAPGTGFLQGSWFTFDHLGSGDQRWYTFGGNVQAGSASATLAMYQNIGGNFNAGPVTSATQVGTITLTFADCTNGSLTFAFTEGSNRSGTIPLTRLTSNVTCTATGSASSPDFAFSGNWFNAATSGQGFAVELNPTNNLLFLAWYTYATNTLPGVAGQRWYTGQANYSPGVRSIPFALYETKGGAFNASPPVPTTTQVGTGTLTFSSCSAARVSYSFSAGSNVGQTGSIDVTRVGPTPSGCAF